MIKTTRARTKSRRNVDRNIADKKELVDAVKAGGCVLCGYRRCFHSLVFHHVDPTTKNTMGRTDHSSGVRYSEMGVRTLARELDKCICVCANCHGEIHAGLHPEYEVQAIYVSRRDQPTLWGDMPGDLFHKVPGAGRRKISGGLMHD